MKKQLEEIERSALVAASAAEGTEQINELRVRFLGKKGELTGLLRSMGSLPAEDRPAVGQMVNDARQRIEAEIELRLEKSKEAEKAARLSAEALDVTMPGKLQKRGKLHPLTQTMRQIVDIFVGMGFEVAEGPEIEYDKYNFEMLNIPADHPARDMQDTFYITDSTVLRTHTSPVQVRTMLNKKPPIRVVCPGRVYRSDDVDATHSPIFHQIEGLVVDKGVTMADLRGVLDVFAKELYGEHTKTRLRPSYFPFTEPSAEVDITCHVCGGSGCRVCKGTGWIEILGSGMVNPNVLRMSGIDPEVYTGFAFGIGIERVANAKFGISDIRLHYENDLRFLSQF
ncbi:MAG: phenylalanine--tRNA ligase subunit alpha [Christensenellales bacterium]